MRFNRIIAGTITAGLVGLVPVAVSSPASATETLTTATTVTTYSEVPITYGDEITLSADVAASDGASAYKGTVSLYVSTPAVPAWTLVANGTGTYDSFDVKPATNASYKVVYSGYTAATAYEDNYVASESAPFAVTMQRKIAASNKSTTFFGKITPDYAKKAVKVERKFGKSWKKYKLIKTDAKGKWRIKLPAPSSKKTFWRFSIPADSNFLGWAVTGWTRRY